MSKEVILERVTAFSKKIGETIKQHREIVFKDSQDDFSYRLSQYSGLEFTSNDIKCLENGDTSKINMDKIIIVWMFLQKIEKIISICEQKELLFLASQESIPNIEQEMMENNSKNG